MEALKETRLRIEMRHVKTGLQLLQLEVREIKVNTDSNRHLSVGTRTYFRQELIMVTSACCTQPIKLVRLT